ncbi:anthranilate synthase family protein [Frankia umida]
MLPAELLPAELLPAEPPSTEPPPAEVLRRLVAACAAGEDPGPFALLRRAGTGADADRGELELELLRGELITVARIADLPLPPGGTGPRVLAIVPFRQLTEVGLPCVDDGSPLEALRVTEHLRVPLGDALAVLPTDGPSVHGGGFDLDDDQYAEQVRAVVRDEIGHGEGSNFVLHRTYTATLDGPPPHAALAALHHLLHTEPGAYWTFLIHTGRRTLVGATPERHVSAVDGQVTMNPICGTHRLPSDPPGSFDLSDPSDPSGAARAGLMRFLNDAKEIDELSMVLDEELKMMAALTDDGARVVGPHLKRMSRLVHTEYLLTGHSDADVRDILRATMFAPTVTGSPLHNALRVLARHERRGRRYYGGVAALLGFDTTGRQTLDAPILIRTAELTPDGQLRLPVGATLVRHSTPSGETAETHTKAAAILAAFGLRPAPTQPTRPTPRTEDPVIAAVLASRNTDLATFWFHRSPRRPLPPQAIPPGCAEHPSHPGSAEHSSQTGSAEPLLAGRSVLVVDAEDAFAVMLAHQLRSLGLRVTVRPWSQVTPPTDDRTAPAPEVDAMPEMDAVDLLVLGPGPGDPLAYRGGDPKMVALRRLAEYRLALGRPLLGVCLGHQLLADVLGLPLRRRPDPHQGLGRTIDLFGRPRRVGYYSTFAAVASTRGDSSEGDPSEGGSSEGELFRSGFGPVRLARDRGDGTVHALRGPSFVGMQFHPESVLSRDGLDILRTELSTLFAAAPIVPVG